MFAWKATTKTSLAQKDRAPKRSLASKEILISAIRLAVNFVTISPADSLLLRNWQSLTASALPDSTYMQACICSKFYMLLWFFGFFFIFLKIFLKKNKELSQTM